MNAETRGWELDDAVRVELADDSSFLKITETLTRIGIANHKTKELTQSCNLLHKKGAYYLCHFKVLFALDGKQTQFDFNDWRRQNAIAKLLEEWGLLNTITELEDNDCEEAYKIKVIKFADKENWTLKNKYSIGN